MRSAFLFFFLWITANNILLASEYHKGDDTLGGHLVFIENVGQWADNYRYKADLPTGCMYLFDSKIVVDLHDKAMVADLMHFKMLPDEEKKLRGKPNTEINAHCYEMIFKNALQPEIIAQSCIPSYYNYYIGNDSSRWKSMVHGYRQIEYNGLYKGVDMHIFESDETLKYEFHIEAGAKPSDIHIVYNGVSGLSTEEGNLIIKTSLGTVTELRPVAWQIVNGDSIPVVCEYQLKNNSVQFVFPDGYNRSEALIIDPTIVFSTYSGSTADNWGYTATYDQNGYVYAGGNIFGNGYPTTVGAYQIAYGGNIDVVLTKYNTTGNTLIYSTYFGGSGPEVPNSLVVNSANELFVLSTTGSVNFPTTPGCLDNTFNGGSSYTLTNVVNYTSGSDLGITCFNSTGTALIASTYFGGTSNDNLNMDLALKHNYADDVRGEILVDENSNVFVVGSTASSDFPTTSGSFQPVYGGGSQDGFLMKCDRLLTTLQWSSFLGGSGADAVYSISVNENGNVYVSGGTNSQNFSTTAGVVMPAWQGGTADGFVSMVSATGANLLRSTYWGTTAYDQTYFVETDKQNNVYLFGQSSSTGTALIQNATWNTPGGGQYITKLRPLLNTIEWSTRFGNGNGIVNISPTAFLVDYCHNIYLSGWGSPSLNGFGGTAGLPITAGAFQSVTDNNDYYFMCMRDDASGIVFGSYYGGSSAEHVDGGTSRFDRLGRIYQSVCAGCGGLDDFPTTVGAWSNTNNSTNCNNGVVKIDFSLPAIVADFSMPPAICLPYTINFTNSSYFPNPGLEACFWDFGDGNTSNNCNPSYTYTNPGVYDVTLIVTDATSCNSADTLIKQIVVLANSVDTLADEGICVGGFTQIGVLPFSDPSITCQWNPTIGLSSGMISNPTASPLVTTEYMLVISNGVCYDTLYQTVYVYNLQADAGPDTTTCSPGLILTASAIGGNSFTYQWSSDANFSDTLNSSPSDNTAATIHTSPHTYYLFVDNGYCTVIDSVFVDYQQLNLNIVMTQPLCNGDCNGSITSTPTGGTPPFTYLWGGGETTATISNICAGSYSLTVNDSKGCLQNTNVMLNQPQPLSIDTLVGPVNCDIACNGFITLAVFGGTGPYNYNWSNGATTEDLTGICMGDYSITITDNHGCKLSDTLNVPVDYIYANVDAWTDYDTIFQGQTTGIHATSYSGVDYLWSPPYNLVNVNVPNTNASPEVTTTYHIHLDDGYGCIYDDSVTIVVLEVFCYEPFIFVPNSFTPNGDGLNDILFVRSLYMQTMYIAIYDRWGEKVFETTDPFIGWDGTFRGEQLEPAVFDYYLKVECYNHVYFEKKGNITLLR
ncbi:MAG: hypothetical protein CVU11_13905 [Bacteroidetes bacterium HGW-Bacteroidetes-6]|jgi:gliding motility-associated-like protein|nr:MAG: hypothetical protein CVU11_13905 [Bacteroidetes bacterium HGW-Bacteroidetes-6]